jgi:hypothetical protein
MVDGRQPNIKKGNNMLSLGNFLRGIFFPPQESPFRRTWPGWVIVALNVLLGIMSANFFLGMMKVGVSEWLLMNTCVPSQLLFLLGFLIGCPVVMLAGSMVMFYYGTLGMLTFSWSSGNLFAQAGHICMTLAVIYTVVEAIRQKRWKSWAAGLTFGFLFWIPFNINQFFYFVANPDLAKDLFSGNLIPPGY